MVMLFQCSIAVPWHFALKLQLLFPGPITPLWHISQPLRLQVDLKGGGKMQEFTECITASTGLSSTMLPRPRAEKENYNGRQTKSAEGGNAILVQQLALVTFEY